MTEPSGARVALVTGGNRGVGEAISRRLAAEGFMVYVGGRDGDRVREVAADIEGRPLAFDVTDPRQVDTVRATLTADGVIPEILVNSAGIFALAPIAETPPEVIDRTLAVNLRGALRVTRAFLPAMTEARRGLIVNLGSVSGRRPLPENGAYAASKFGLRGFHEVLVEELRGSGVRACLLEPGAVDTAMWDGIDPGQRPDLPARRDMLRPDDVARAVSFVASQPRHVSVPLLQIQPA